MKKDKFDVVLTCFNFSTRDAYRTEKALKTML